MDLPLGKNQTDLITWNPTLAQHLLLMGGPQSGKTLVLDRLAQAAAQAGWRVFYFSAADFADATADFESFYRVMMQEVELTPHRQFLLLLDDGEQLLQATGGVDPSNSILASLYDEELSHFHVAVAMETIGLLEMPAFHARVGLGQGFLEEKAILELLALPKDAQLAWAQDPSAYGIVEYRYALQASYKTFTL